jgi:tetratricopeptide (TPR) repeat protein
MADTRTCVGERVVVWASEDLGAPSVRGSSSSTAPGPSGGTLTTIDGPASVRLSWEAYGVDVELRPPWEDLEPSCEATGAPERRARAASVAARSRTGAEAVACRETAVAAWEEAGWMREHDQELRRLAVARLAMGIAPSDIGALPTPAREDLDASYADAYVLGTLESQRGRLRGARQAYRRALRLAERARPAWAASARAELADLASRTGDHDGALELLAPRVTAASSSEERLHAHLDISWAMLRAREEHVRQSEVLSSPVAMDPAAHLDLARQLVRANPDLERHRVDVWVNLALQALHDGDLDRAATALGEAGGASYLHTEHWRAEAEARLSLARADLDTAQRVWTELEARSRASGDLAARWRALDGLARTALAAGDPLAADASWREPERAFVEQSAFVPMFHGREAFLGRRRSAAVSQAEGRLQRGDLKGASDLLRGFRRQYLATLRVPDRVEAMDTGSTANWESALDRYVQTRARRQEVVERLRVASDTERASLQAELESLQLEASEAFDTGMSSVMPDLSADRGGPGRGEWFVSVVRDQDRWVAVARGAKRLLGASGTSVAALWPQLAPGLSGAERIVWMTGADADAADPHAAWPLSDRTEQVWSLDRRPPRPPRSGTRALVVADPLRNLPAARAEGVAVAQALTAQGLDVELLVGRQASPQRVLEALADPTLAVFHYAGHGEVGEDTWDAQLVLARGAALRIPDLLALSTAPPIVVLAGCETATTTQPGAGTFGLAQAFVAAGSEAVVATTRKVDDELAAAFSEALYAADPVSNGPIAAWHASLSSLRAGADARDWQTFRLFVP